MEDDIRWEQRFSNFVKAMDKLAQAVEYIEKNSDNEEEEKTESSKDTLSEIIREGLIQRFEYTHELAWNVMKDYVNYQGNNDVGGSRDATREAFQLKLISDGEVWMEMIGSRNKTSHTYNEDIAQEIFSKILMEYYPAFRDFQQTMEAKRSGEQSTLF